jgi:hypothetical protein
MARTLKATAYAVIDAAGKVRFTPGYDVYFSLKNAREICKGRRNAAYPTHPEAQWQVVRVLITPYE